MRRPFQSLVYLFKKTKEVLLLLRTEENGGFWQGVTGGVEGEETFLQAACREVFEETRIVPVSIQEIDYGYFYPITPQWAHKFPRGAKQIFEQVFMALVAPDVVVSLNPREHCAFRWVSVDEAIQLLYWEENKRALHLCEKNLFDFIDRSL